MTPCLVSTGFFVLGRCGRPAVAGCGRCGRPVCDQHVGAGLCPECAAAQGYGTPYDPYWATGYRSSYYHASSTSYSDPTWYGTFDDYDRGAFDPGAQDDFGEGDFDYGGEDFVDS